MLHDLCRRRHKLSQVLVYKLSQALNPLTSWGRTNRESANCIDGGAIKGGVVNRSLKQAAIWHEAGKAVAQTWQITDGNPLRRQCREHIVCSRQSTYSVI